MSPQQKDNYTYDNEKYNPFQADVYSLGVTFVHLAALTFPIELGSRYQKERVEAKIAELTCSDRLKSLLLGMLAYEEDSRPSMQQVYDALTSEQLPAQVQQTEPPFQGRGRNGKQLPQEPEETKAIALESVPEPLEPETQPERKGQDLAHVSENHVKFFRFPNKTWERVLLTKPAKVDDFTQYVWAASGLFCCGGNCYSGFTGSESTKQAFLLEENGAKWNPSPYADMHEGRHNHGIWWDANQLCVFVFGGESAGTGHTRNLAACEKWTMGPDTWSDLPSMEKERWCFNPCEFRNTVYLCGGYTDLIEAFNPQTSTFSVMRPLFPESSSSSVSIVAKGRLVVLSLHYVSVWDLDREQLLQEHSRARHVELGVWCNMAPILDVEDGQFYTSCKGDCWRVQLDGSGKYRINSR